MTLLLQTLQSMERRIYIHFLCGTGFVRSLKIFGDGIQMYINKSNSSVILVHKPLCLNGDAQNNVQIKMKILRGMTAAVLQRLVCFLQ
jgi:hypothetical protein